MRKKERAMRDIGICSFSSAGRQTECWVWRWTGFRYLLAETDLYRLATVWKGPISLE